MLGGVLPSSLYLNQEGDTMGIIIRLIQRWILPPVPPSLIALREAMDQEMDVVIADIEHQLHVIRTTPNHEENPS